MFAYSIAIMCIMFWSLLACEKLSTNMWLYIEKCLVVMLSSASLVQRWHQSMFASCNCSNHMPSASIFELVDVTWAHTNLCRPCLLECFASLDGTDYCPGKSGCSINNLALKRQYWFFSAIVPCTMFDNGFIEIPVPKNMYVDVGIVLIARLERYAPFCC